MSGHRLRLCGVGQGNDFGCEQQWIQRVRLVEGVKLTHNHFRLVVTIQTDVSQHELEFGCDLFLLTIWFFLKAAVQTQEKFNGIVESRVVIKCLGLLQDIPDLVPGGRGGL